MRKKRDIAIYQTEGSKIELRVQLERGTAWLDQKSIAELFSVNVPAISKHIKKILSDGELGRDQTVSKMEIVQEEGSRKVKRQVDAYNLDMIISVGYRVNSKRATQFRIWATDVLRSYLVDGYAINQKRLEEEVSKFKRLQSQLKVLKNVVENEDFSLDQSKQLLRVIADYSEGLELIDDVDKGELSLPRGLTQKKDAVGIDYSSARSDIDGLRKELHLHDLFGKEKDTGLKAALGSIFQTYGKKPLYPSIEEKAANLLYLIIKDHPFIDGNKRIGSFMFVRFLDMNGMLYASDGSRLLDESALVAIALLIAQSEMNDKEIMVTLVVNLIAGGK